MAGVGGRSKLRIRERSVNAQADEGQQNQDKGGDGFAMHESIIRNRGDKFKTG